MRRQLSVLLSLALLCSLIACGNRSSPVNATVSPPVQEVKSEAQLAMEAILSQYEGTEERDQDQALLAKKIHLPDEELQAVEDYLSANIPAYPYGDLIQLEAAYERYLALERREASPSGGMVSALPISGAEMLEHVRTNNDAFLAIPSIENSLFRPLDEAYFSWVCQVAADTINRELAEVDFGVQLASIDWNLEHLKILQGGTVANASYLKGALMQVRPSGADGMVTLTGDEMAAHKTVTHEVEHLLQNMAAPTQEALGISQNYGFSYQWEDLEVNSLYCTWFTEASAERLAAAFYGSAPSTYKSMIGYLDSLTMPALLRGKQPIEVPRLSQQPYLETVFAFFDCQSEEEQRELLNLLYAIELIQVTPDDFWEDYAAAYGLDAAAKSDDDQGALRKSLKPSVCLTLSRYFYRDLSRLLAEEGMTLRELFYLMSMWEFDLSGHILYDDEGRLEDTKEFLSAYTALQNCFLDALAPYSGLTVQALREAFTAYLCRCEVPRQSMLQGDETWTKGVPITAVSAEGNAFLDEFYETVSQNKTVPVYAAAEILLTPSGERNE